MGYRGRLICGCGCGCGVGSTYHVLVIPAGGQPLLMIKVGPRMFHNNDMQT